MAQFNGQLIPTATARWGLVIIMNAILTLLQTCVRMFLDIQMFYKHILVIHPIQIDCEKF